MGPHFRRQYRKGFISTDKKPMPLVMKPSSEDRNPAVSIVLATNRGGPYLRETLQSVSAQTFTDWELIVVDDGSNEPEAIVGAVDGMAGSRVIRQANAGISIARNVGFANSSGEFVAYLDDDDVWDPERLARQVDALRSDPTAASCHCGYWFIDGAGLRFGTEVKVRPASSESYLSGEVDIPRINTLLLRRSVVQRLGGFLSSFSLYEDCEFVFRVVKEGPVISLPDHLVGWRRYPGSVSFMNDVRVMNAAAVRAVTIVRWGAETQGNSSEAKTLAGNVQRTKRRLADHHASEFCHHVRTRHWNVARSELAEGLHYSPSTVLRTCVSIALRRSASEG